MINNKEDMADVIGEILDDVMKGGNNETP